MANTINSQWHPRARTVARRNLAAALIHEARQNGKALAMFSNDDGEICWLRGKVEYRIERAEFSRAMREGVVRILWADKAAGLAKVTAGDNALDVDCKRPLGTTTKLVESGRIPSPPWRDL